MKCTVFLFAFALSLSAAPVLLPDGINLSPDDPGLGRQIYANPGSCWIAGLNDNPSGVEGDFDFNDGMARLCFGSSTAGATSGLAYWLGATTADLTELFIGLTPIAKTAATPFLAPTDSEVILHGVDLSYGRSWFSGPASRNPVGGIQFWVTKETEQPSDVPDPSTLAMVLSGAATMRAVRRTRA